MTNSPIKPRRSRLLAALRAGHSATSFKLNLADPRATEIASMRGIDAIWLCNEHVPNDWLNLEGQIRAAKLYDVDTFVRVEKGSYSDYVRPFEAGANGILVPHVTTRDEAANIVQWTRFRPVGRRAIDGGNADSLFCGLPLADYIANSLREQFIIMQIESPEALENVEEIASVPGYDMLCFGPGDYSHLIGRPGELDAPEVVHARRRIADAARRHGKYVMAAVMSAPRAVLEEEGHSLFNIGADVVALAEYVSAKVRWFNCPLPSPEGKDREPALPARA